jgi:Peptidase family M23
MRRLVPVVLLVLFVLAAAGWTWPVRGPVLEPFSFDPSHPYGAGQHRGIAIGADAGAPVLAPATGVVRFAGTVPTNGKTITIETPGGLAVSLTHLGSIAVARDASVAEGSVVGTVGPSGTAEFDVPYVHLGIRTAAEEQGYLDPLGFLPVLAPPVPAPPRRLPPRSSRSRNRHHRPRQRHRLPSPARRLRLLRRLSHPWPLRARTRLRSILRRQPPRRSRHLHLPRRRHPACRSRRARLPPVRACCSSPGISSRGRQSHPRRAPGPG